MRIIAALIVSGALAACGADGEPVQPTMNSTLTLSNSGVGVQTDLSVTRGPVTFGVGLGL